jgi:hypothetical protein
MKESVMESEVDLEFLTTTRLAEHERSVAQWQLGQTAREIEREQATASSSHCRLPWLRATTRLRWRSASLRQLPGLR